MNHRTYKFAFIHHSFFFFAVQFFFLSSLLGQTSLLYEKTYGGESLEFGRAILPLETGEFILVGETYGIDSSIAIPLGGIDYLMIKISSLGETIWTKTKGGPENDRPLDIINTSDGNFMTIGETKSQSGDVSGGNGDSDVWLTKFDNDGEIIWEQTYGGSDIDRGFGLLEVENRNILAIAESHSTNGDVSGVKGLSDYWIIKTDENGVILWTKSFGGTKQDFAWDLILDDDGNYLIIGSSGSNDGDFDSNFGDFDFWLVKLDQNGELLSNKNFGGSKSEALPTMIKTEDGGLAIIGRSRSADNDMNDNYGDYDISLLKLDNLGNRQWHQNYGGTSDDDGSSIHEVDNGYIITGTTRSADIDISSNQGLTDIIVLMVDKLGNVIFSETFGGSSSERAHRRILQDGLLKIIGSTRSSDGDVSIGNNTEQFWLLEIELLSALRDREKNETFVVDNLGSGFHQISSKDKIKQVSLFDISGHNLLSVEPNSQTQQIQISNPGIYILDVTTQSSRQTKKCIFGME